MKDRKAAGTSRERQVVAAYRELGFVAFRTPASLGVCDVVAMRPMMFSSGSSVFMAEVKCNRGSPWMNFRRNERYDLSEAAKRAGAVPLLVHWPPNKPRRDYYEEEWP